MTPAAPALAGATVLIVDDDVRNVFALTSALELHGLTVLYADNGAAGIRLLTEHPEVDVVLMDTMMPDLDGNETTRLIRELPGGRELPVVFLTAKAMPGDREASLAAGATEYVTKPVDLDELLALMANWVTPPPPPPPGGADDRPSPRARRRRPAGEPAGAAGHPGGAGGRGRFRHERGGRAQAAAHRGLRGDPARRPHARHGRLRDGRAHQAARAHPAHPGPVPHGGGLRPAPGVPRLPGGRGRLHHQAVRPVGAALEGRRVRRPLVGARAAGRAGRRSAIGCAPPSTTPSSSSRTGRSTRRATG